MAGLTSYLKHWTRLGLDLVPHALSFPLQRLYYQRSGEPELALLPYLCDRSKLSLDIGSNMGAYTLFLLQHSESVVCFEPNESLCKYLRRKFAKKRVTIHEVALGKSDRVTELQVPVFGTRKLDGLAKVGKSKEIEWQGHRITDFVRMPVDMRTLDSYDLKNIGLIKIDVEGHEYDVLSGAQETLAREFPNILVEVERRHAGDTFTRTFEFLQAMGYSGFFLDSGSLRSISEFHAATMQDPANADGFGRYVANFIFAKDPEQLSRTVNLGNEK